MITQSQLLRDGAYFGKYRWFLFSTYLGTSTVCLIASALSLFASALSAWEHLGLSSWGRNCALPSYSCFMRRMMRANSLFTFEPDYQLLYHLEGRPPNFEPLWTRDAVSYLRCCYWSQAWFQEMVNHQATTRLLEKVCMPLSEALRSASDWLVWMSDHCLDTFTAHWYGARHFWELNWVTLSKSLTVNQEGLSWIREFHVAPLSLISVVEIYENNLLLFRVTKFAKNQE